MYTELELVNHLLQTLGTSTTSTLETQHPAVVRAKQTLLSYNKEFQGTGWWFNRELNFKLLPDANGRVLIPTEALSFAVTNCILATRSAGSKQRFVKRGKYVYDAYSHTDQLGVAVWADITMLLDYEDLPQSAGSYLKHMAAAEAFLADDGDINVYTKLQIRQAKAWGLLQQDQIKSVKPNALQSPYSTRLRHGLHGSGYATNNEVLMGGGNIL